jgi:hypothetical protein
MQTLIQTGGSDRTPVKYGKLPNSGKVNVVIQFSKYAATDDDKDAIMKQGYETDCDLYRPIFAKYDTDIKQVKKLIAKHRHNLLCIMITTPNFEKPLFIRSRSQTAFNFFDHWLRTNPTMYTLEEA